MMTEIKPVYQWQHANRTVLPYSWWQDCTEADFNARGNKSQFNSRILYPADVVEELQKENAFVINDLHIARSHIGTLKKESAAQAKRIADLEFSNTVHELSRGTTKEEMIKKIDFLKNQAEEMLTAMRRAVLALAFAAEKSRAMQDDYQALSNAIAKAVASKNGEPK